MKFPERYMKTVLPVKVPPKPGTVNKELLAEFENSIGYLEQTLSEPVITSLFEVGSTRYLFPTLSRAETALKHFAILLKYYNPTNSEYLKSKYYKKLKDFKC